MLVTSSSEKKISKNHFLYTHMIERPLKMGPFKSSLCPRARSFLGGEFAGGESAWWRGDR